jgi:mannose-6-phosphate isomerase-like protein (cupin superfamily)
MAAESTDPADRITGRPRASEAYALQLGQGWTYQNGIDFTVKAGEFKTANGAAIVEYTTRKGEEPGEHTHPTEDEMFYVMAGALRTRHEITLTNGQSSGRVRGWTRIRCSRPSSPRFYHI